MLSHLTLIRMRVAKAVRRMMYTRAIPSVGFRVLGMISFSLGVITPFGPAETLSFVAYSTSVESFTGVWQMAVRQNRVKQKNKDPFFFILKLFLGVNRWVKYKLFADCKIISPPQNYIPFRGFVEKCVSSPLCSSLLSNKTPHYGRCPTYARSTNPIPATGYLFLHRMGGKGSEPFRRTRLGAVADPFLYLRRPVKRRRSRRVQ